MLVGGTGNNAGLTGSCTFEVDYLANNRYVSRVSPSFARRLRRAPCVVHFLIRIPETALPAAERERDLGWMLHDIDFDNGRAPRLFRARLEHGVIDVPTPDDGRARR